MHNKFVFAPRLAAAFGLAVSGALAAFAADTDENGLSPYYWNRLDGTHKTEVGQVATPLNWTGTATITYVDSRGGKAMSGYTPYSNSDFALGDGAWTVVESARLGAWTKEVAVFAAGSGARDGIAVVYAAADTVKLMAFSGGNGTKNTATTKTYGNDVAVPNLAGQFHDFALVVAQDGATTTATLYVDGALADSLACPFDRVPYKTAFQLGAVYDGSTVSGSSTAIHIDDFRLYRQGLSAAQVAAVAAAFRPWPADYWYKFDESLDQSGFRTAAMTQEKNTTIAYESSFGGGKAIKGYSAYATSRTGIHVSDDGNFTASIVAKVPAAAKKVVWDVGQSNGANANYNVPAKPIFLASTATGVELAVTDGKPSGSATVTALFTVDIPTAATRFHHYAIKVDHANSMIHFYVDGVEQGTGAAHADTVAITDYPMQFLGIYNGMPGGYSIGYDTVMDDFQLWSKLLSDDEIAEIADSFPPWPEADALGGLPRYWMRMNGSLRQSGELAATFNGAAAHQGAFVTDGASPERSALGYRSVQGFADYTPNAAASYLDLGGTDWTLMATAKVEEDAQGRAVVFCLGRSTDATHGSAFVAVDGSVASLKRFVYGDTASTTLARKRVDDPEGEFHHYAVTCEGGAKLSFFVDGAKFGEATTTLSAASLPFQPAAVFSNAPNCGYRNVVSYGNVLDDWRLYGRVLTDAEIAQIALDEFGLKYVDKPFVLTIR